MTGRPVLPLLLAIVLVANLARADFSQSEDEARRFEALEQRDLLRRFLWRNGGNRRHAEDAFENWHGRWMPDRPGDPTPPPKVLGNDGPSDDRQPLHGVSMGQPSANCDDAKTNLTVDWDYSPVNYTCYDKSMMPDRETRPMLYCERIPKHYVAKHKCMYDKIEYDDDVPVYGTHRPLWPVYGEYKFLPKQRWLHSLEHGAIAMLYHPCANPLEIKRLKSLVTGCLRRHVITPYNLLDENRPLALLAWGCRLTMSYVNPAVVTKFIRSHALRGPEEIPEDGDFRDGLLSPAKTVSDGVDSVICPNDVRAYRK